MGYEKVYIAGDRTVEYGEKIRNYFKQLNVDNWDIFNYNTRLLYWVDNIGQIRTGLHAPEGYVEVKL